MTSTKTPEGRGFKVTLILMLGLATFSSAVKDLNRLQELVGYVQEFASQWDDNGLLATNQKLVATEEGSCLNDGALLSNTWTLSTLTDRVEPEVGGNAEVVASKKANRRVARLEGFTRAPARVPDSVTLLRSGKGNLPEQVQNKRHDREVALDLLRTVVTDMKVEGLNDDAMSHFPAGFVDKISRREPQVRTGNSKRGFVFKRLDGNISLRPSS